MSSIQVKNKSKTVKVKANRSRKVLDHLVIKNRNYRYQVILVESREQHRIDSSIVFAVEARVGVAAVDDENVVCLSLSKERFWPFGSYILAEVVE